MSKMIVLSLDEHSIDEAIKELESYRQGVSDKTETLVRRVCDRGAEDAKSALSWQDWRGSLGWAIEATKAGSVHRVGSKVSGSYVCADPRATFVEFGTGFIGAGHPHELAAQMGWAYDVNQHGDKGWWYPTDPADPNPYKRVISGELKAWTKGMPSRPFMHLSYEMQKHNIKQLAREVFNP